MNLPRPRRGWPWGESMQRMTPEQRDAMSEHMPPPPRDMWMSFGENAFNELSAQVVVDVDGR